MDIAYYLSELLGELGAVNVTGLGSFTQQKIDGYYKSSEGEFYPPAAEVHYSQDFTEDDILAEYIAEQKKISLASSKYFIEKYSSKMKVDVLMEDVQVAGLGWIYPQGNGLAFKRSASPLVDPDYYGYPKIKMQQLGGTTFAGHVETNISAPQNEPELPLVLHDVAIAEPESPGLLHEEQVLPAVHEAAVTEPEVISEKHQDQEPLTPAVLHHEAVAEPEIESIAQEESSLPPAEELEPVADPADLIVPQRDPFEVKEEPANPPLDFGAQMEDYLRELEAGAYISGPETTEPAKSPEPVIPETITERPGQEIASVQVVELPKTGSVHEPVIENPKIEPVPEPLTAIPFPEHTPASYEPDAELQQYMLNETTVTPQPHTYTPEQVKSAHDEEEFVFDGKGYDDVDNRRDDESSRRWLWITLGIIVLVAGAAAFLYFKHEQKVKQQLAEAAAPAPIPVVKKDTLKKIIPVNSSKDSLQKAKDSTKNSLGTDTTGKAAHPVGAANAIDSAKVRYELIAIKCKTKAEANLRIKNYKSLGIADAHIVTGPIDGPLIKISLGTYLNRTDAIKRKHELARDVSSIDIKKINPKK